MNQELIKEFKMNQTSQKCISKTSNSFKSPCFNHSGEQITPTNNSKRAHQVPMLRNKPDIKKLLREEEE